MLYNIEEEQYNWYVNTKEEETNTYVPLQIAINNASEIQTTEDLPKQYIMKDGEKTSVETVDGEEISIDKFDEVFIDPEIENKEIDFSIDLDEKDLKNVIETSVEEFKEQEQLVREEIKQNVAEKETAVENKQEEIKKAQEEVKKKEEEEAKKAAEEEAKRKAAEEAKKGLKVGDCTLKYGKYTSDVGQMDSSMYGTITLNSDGTFHIKSNCDGRYPYPKLDCDGTYKVTKVLNSFEYYDGIEFKTNTGVTFSFEVYQNNAFSDQWHGYTYSGN